MNELLKVCYGLNLIILGPVLISMFSDGGTKNIRAFEGQVENSEGLRTLVASLWMAIFVLSIAGLFQPKVFAPILMLQVVYKLTFLLTYVLPMAKSHGLNSIPKKLSITFLAIVLLWPVFLACS